MDQIIRAYVVITLAIIETPSQSVIALFRQRTIANGHHFEIY